MFKKRKNLILGLVGLLIIVGLILLVGKIVASQNGSSEDSLPPTPSEEAIAIDDYLYIANKQNALPSSYVPSDLVVPNVKIDTGCSGNTKVRSEAAGQLEKMFADAESEGITLYLCSAYRSYEEQEVLFNNYVAKYGIEEANKFSAKPGESEHQLGLAIDVSGTDPATRLETSFGETPEGVWLKNNCAEYGFIIRYPLGKEGITGYQYEPWHIRYVGLPHAEKIMEAGMVLEEYKQ